MPKLPASLRGRVRWMRAGEGAAAASIHRVPTLTIESGEQGPQALEEAADALKEFRSYILQCRVAAPPM